MYYEWNMPRAFPMETVHFLWKYYIKKIKLPLLKNLHLPTKKYRTASVFMLE